ncbi:MAG: hypothetical protein HKN87_11485 [Saprospiraceae bacterium]|nr:hypothetical protein [Saprospiraceae bacterium]
MKYLQRFLRDYSALVVLHIVLLSNYGILAQERPELAFREDFMETPAEIPINQSHLANQSLTLALHGPGKDVIKKSHHDKPTDDPYYVWSGLCDGNWAVSLGPEKPIDLRGLSKIIWRSKQAGFRQLRVILKLADGTWLVSSDCDGPSVDWRIHAFNIGDMKWRSLDIDKVVEGNWVETPDLSQVVEVGWTDLMPGGGSNACSRLDWIEVYAHANE